MRRVIKKQERPKRRSGIRIKGQRGDQEVGQALIRFARWLRQNYDFPIRVPVYLHPTPQLSIMGGGRASASFFAPWDRQDEPYIRMATGDYKSLKSRRGRDNALAAFIVSLSHEVIHYQQWIATGLVSEKGVSRGASGMLRRYSETRNRP